MTTLVVLALADEAPMLAQHKNVFFTGIGKVNAASTVAELIEIHKPTQIINFGTAGGITVGPGLHKATRFVQRDMQCVELGALPGQTPNENTGVVLEIDDSGLTCSTGDNFVTNPNLEIPADLVDMEAYAIAKVCRKKHVKFLCYKFVSDNANENAATDWSTMISAGQQLYIDKLRELNII